MASKRHIRRKQCEFKIRFDSMERAEKYARNGTEPYFCQFCKGFHVGHPRNGGGMREFQKPKGYIVNRED